MFCNIDLLADKVSNHGEPKEHSNAMRATFSNPDKLNDGVHDARPTNSGRRACWATAALLRGHECMLCVVLQGQADLHAIQKQSYEKHLLQGGRGGHYHGLKEVHA